MKVSCNAASPLIECHRTCQSAPSEERTYQYYGSEDEQYHYPNPACTYQTTQADAQQDESEYQASYYRPSVLWFKKANKRPE